MKYTPINPKFSHIIHGGDYNPEQWLHFPEVIEKDFKLMNIAHCNTMTIGVFAWSSLEPEEGVYNFEWLDRIMDRLAENNMYAVLATPSGGKPSWLSKKYPEVLRVLPDRRRILHGERHNHCFTSPIYREKVANINRKLAERYKEHPSLLVWHISNEFGGDCHCELCQEAFRKWLKNKYNNDLDKLNKEWWTAFWSHTYTDWSQIESPSPIGEMSIHGLNLDWRRFVTDQTIDFIKNEIKPLKELTPKVPITTNFMGTYPGLNYQKFKDVVDVISWDSYPQWHENKSDVEVALYTSFQHSINRSIKGGKPFMLMESTPSTTNWQPVSKLKKPKMHILSSLLAVANGSDTVQYFQWRKSRGGYEKFHGAVVDHVGNEHTRVFKEVSALGEILEKLDEIVGTTVEAEVGMIYDWENLWAIDDLKGLISDKKNYEKTCVKHFNALNKRGIPVDIIDMESDFSKYKLLVAPMLYMIKPGVAKQIENFVSNGGIFVATYWSGIVNENDLCFLGGFPGPLSNVLGIWAEEIDSLYDNEKNYIKMKKNNFLDLKGEYKVVEFCELIHTKGASTLGIYKEDFYAGQPAVTLNHFGNGKAFYIAARTEYSFLKDFYKSLQKKINLKRIIETEIPKGVIVLKRTDGKDNFIFILNFNQKSAKINLDKKEYYCVLSDRKISGKLVLEGYGFYILKSKVM